MTRLLAAAAVAGAWWVWWAFPAPGADPVVDLIAMNSPRLHAAIRAWHYLAPAVALLGAWSVAVAVGRVMSSVTGLYVWLDSMATGRLPVWGVTGYVSGALLLTPGGGPAPNSGLAMAMAAAGTRGEWAAASSARRGSASRPREYGPNYRLGYTLGGEGLGVDAQRHESPLRGGTDHGVLGRASVRR